MTATIYLLTLCLPLATILIVFGMRYYAQIQQAKAHKANDDTLRQMADALNDVRNRLAAVEKILKDVG
jgi:hypothetical protein